MKLATPFLFLIITLSWISKPVTEVNNDLWFGYYQENRANNPEDPMAGMVYLNIPDNGTFEGEMFFSYAGCDGNFDVGNVSGTVLGGKITGQWEGQVDGIRVGGSYNGSLSTDQKTYSGTWTNSRGKQEIDCGDDGGYFVAGLGSWTLNKTNESSNLDVEVTVDAASEYAEFTWNEIDNIMQYRFVVIDRDCLLEKMNLEECMVWTGETDWPDATYGEGDYPAKALVTGTTYIVNVFAIDNTGEVLESASKEFIYR